MKKGDIILINAPFSNLSEKKIRPAVIIGNVQEDYIVCFISSKIENKSLHDILVEPDEENRLRANSIIKCGKLFTLHCSLIKMRLGSLNKEVYSQVIQKITKIIHS